MFFRHKNFPSLSPFCDRQKQNKNVSDFHFHNRNHILYTEKNTFLKIVINKPLKYKLRVPQKIVKCVNIRDKMKQSV